MPLIEFEHQKTAEVSFRDHLIFQFRSSALFYKNAAREGKVLPETAALRRRDLIGQIIRLRQLPENAGFHQVWEAAYPENSDQSLIQ